jgi:hypothetical protein
MKRLFQAVLASAIALAFLSSSPSAYAKGSTMMHSGHHKHSCPAGQHWVKGYKTKNGTKVHGYCRK